MEEQKLTEKVLQSYHDYLIREEKSAATVEKYLRDIRAFYMFVGEKEVSKEIVVAYKSFLQKRCYAVRSINSMLASLNSLFNYMAWYDCKVKCLRLQRQIYCAEERELSKEEYMRLLKVAQGNPKLYLILQTICSTGIRVSELQFFTAEAVRKGEIIINCKGKNRTILLPGKLKKRLLDYMKRQRILEGVIFSSGNGKSMNRSTIWAQMKALCKEADVTPQKVFPHNLRKLFAKIFYRMENDIAKLADILGHSSINTTRIYIMTSGAEHRKKIERLGLVI